MIKRGYINNLSIDNIDFIILEIGFTDYNLIKSKHKNPNFDENYIYVKGNNINIGALYISRATSLLEATEEMEYILNILKNKKINYPIIISFEDDHNTAIYYHINQQNLDRKTFNTIVNYMYNRLIDENYIPIILTKNQFLDKIYNKENYNIILSEQINEDLLHIDIEKLSKEKIKLQNNIIFNKLLSISKLFKVRKK